MTICSLKKRAYCRSPIAPAKFSTYIHYLTEQLFPRKLHSTGNTVSRSSRRMFMRKPVGAMIAAAMLATTSLTPVFGWANGENSCYTKGMMLGSAGISIYHFGAFVAFDYGLHDCISAGLAAGYNGYTYVPEVRTHRIPIVARAAFHPFNLSVLADKLDIRNLIDVYIGLSTGWMFRWQTTKYDLLRGNEPSTFSLREYIGLRYYFTEKLAVFVEDCGEIAYISGGITYKF